MTGTKLATTAPRAARQLRVTAPVKQAIEAMCFRGLSRADAAKDAGLSDHGVYQALRKPHVKRYYLECLDVLRTSARAQNIHRLEAIRDQDDNKMAAVAAIKALEQQPDEDPARSTTGRTPGVVIQIINPLPSPGRPRPIINVTPERGDDDE